MKLVPTSVSIKTATAMLKTRKASPTLLFVGGTVGIVATVVLACKATLELEETLKEAQKDIIGLEENAKRKDASYSEKDYKKDVAYIQVRNVVAVCKLYAPAALVGSMSIGALYGSHNILQNRNNALMGAYIALEKGFNEYRKRVIDEIGPEREEKIRYAVEKVEVINPDGTKAKELVATPKGASIYAKFFDEYSSSWQKNAEYNRIFLQAQQNYANDRLRARGHLFLNEVYDSLGIERTNEGAIVGWRIGGDGDGYVDFGIFNKDSTMARAFVNGLEYSILLDFNVDGVIWDKI